MYLLVLYLHMCLNSKETSSVKPVSLKALKSTGVKPSTILKCMNFVQWQPHSFLLLHVHIARSTDIRLFYLCGVVYTYIEGDLQL